MKLWKKYVIHASGITAFLVLSILLSPSPPEAEFHLLNRPGTRDLLASCIMLAIFYANYYYLIRRFFFNKNFVLYAFLILAGLASIAFLPSLLTGHNLITGERLHSPPLLPGTEVPGMPPKPIGFNPFQEIQHHIFLYMSVILFSLLLRIREGLMRAENEKLQSELSNLRAQIHPHFLFNTLNSIYSLVIQKDPTAPDTLVKLSDFMRYLLKDSNREKVALQNEIYYIENYIALQKTRLRNSVHVNYHFEGVPAGEQIAPLILSTFIENAFKHGVNPEQESIITIHFVLVNNVLSLSIINNIVGIMDGHHNESLNIGLENTKSRLNNLYAGKFELKDYEEDNQFKVSLTIQLD